mgnify:CR=1 FL=1
MVFSAYGKFLYKYTGTLCRVYRIFYRLYTDDNFINRNLHLSIYDLMRTKKPTLCTYCDWGRQNWQCLKLCLRGSILSKVCRIECWDRFPNTHRFLKRQFSRLLFKGIIPYNMGQNGTKVMYVHILLLNITQLLHAIFFSAQYRLV